ncbi:MAG: N-acetylmuramic acid 6-phosphate etherase [Bacteroidetes bacterium]|nr:N-acetylmuramic acid 6-phosphate etherase [Bacteroidota bacterium]HET6245348.1 N-acetylmuramic acid 6-phosphate etherase [Bacteroidia bacterium]
MSLKITESSSLYNNIEKMSSIEILKCINKEDHSVPLAIEAALPQIEKLVDAIAEKMMAGGRLFYLGAGTSGRLGIVDASECPPTYGIPHGMVVGLIAGGDNAIRKAVEFAEDDTQQGWKDLQEHEISAQDVVLGITASGSTPYVVGAIQKCRENGIVTGGISCNPQSELCKQALFPIEVIVGPEFITGSTRMKSGTAQKLVLNMISTTVMVKLGKVKGNKMVDMQLSNVKLIDRGTKMVMDALNVPYQTANSLLKKFGSVRKAIENAQESQ